MTVRAAVIFLCCVCPVAACNTQVDAKERDSHSTTRGPHAAPLAPRLAVELRSYNLEDDVRTEFDRLVREEAMPMLERWGVDVVGFGPSPHDSTSYFLIRSFENLAARGRLEDAFYASAEWREGPREAILALIRNYTTVLLELDPATVAALRADLASKAIPGPGASPENRAADMATSRPCDAPSAADAAAAVRALNDAYIDAARRHDAAWFDTHMAEDIVVILGSGRRLAKADFLAAVRSDARTFRSLTARDVTVRVFGPTVQVDADAPWVLDDGAEGVSRYIDTYAWLDCRWQVVSAQITLLPAGGAQER